jgi:7-cyano-7-deazaguanine synthase in queuosine biosynthesis
MTDGFDADDLAFFEGQRRQAALAQEALRSGRVKAGDHGVYMAFHEGTVLGTSETQDALHRYRHNVAERDLYITFVPGRNDVLVY